MNAGIAQRVAPLHRPLPEVPCIVTPTEMTAGPVDPVAHAFINALETLMQSIDASEEATEHSIDLTRFLYTDIVPAGHPKSGWEYADLLFCGLADKLYTLPRAELRFLDLNRALLPDFFAEKFAGRSIAHISLGCGPYTPVLAKDLPLTRNLHAVSYTAVDFNTQLAVSAAKLIKSKIPSISTKVIAQDFTDRLDFTHIPSDHLMVMTLLGDTIAQYACSNENRDNLSKAPLEVLLTNLGESTGYKAALLATVDAEVDKDSASEKYNGTGLRDLMHTLWWTAKEVTGDANFDPTAFRYTPQFDGIRNAVMFVHEVKKATSLTLRGRTYSIPKGTEIVIGCSQKSAPEQLIPSCEKAGWRAVSLPFRSESTSRAMLLLGKNL